MYSFILGRAETFITKGSFATHRKVHADTFTYNYKIALGIIRQSGTPVSQKYLTSYGSQMFFFTQSFNTIIYNFASHQGTVRASLE